MSAVKNMVLKNFLSIVVLLTFSFCTEKQSDTEKNSKVEEITMIALSNIGGELGYYKTIKITKDSIHLETGETATKKHNSWKSSIDSKTWKNLSSSFKINKLDKIESSPSIQPIDGIDESFQIKTNKTSHVYVNAYNDENYSQFSLLKDRLSKIIPAKYQ